MSHLSFAVPTWNSTPWDMDQDEPGPLVGRGNAALPQLVDDFLTRGHQITKLPSAVVASTVPFRASGNLSSRARCLLPCLRCHALFVFFPTFLRFRLFGIVNSFVLRVRVPASLALRLLNLVLQALPLPALTS